MTASPLKVNGQTRPPALPVLGDWQPTTVTPESEPVEAEAPADVKPDVVAQAEAEAIRAKSWSDAEEQRLKAEAEAEGIRAKAAEEARKLRLANDRAERKAAEEQAASEARIAESRRLKADADRAREDGNRQAREQQQAAELQAAEVAEAEQRWRGYARAFYIVCAIVALPVQVAAFYNPNALWLMAAPLMLEGGAWVVLKGAAAAVAAGRPHWHYRLIAWLLAFIAAGINLWHGLNAFDPATAIGTAFASVAGPGIWDLHEHGRIRRRDGAPTRRERKANEKAAKVGAARRAEEDARQAAEAKAAEEAAAVAAKELAALREKEFPKVWSHALRLAAALGEATVTEPVWRRAHLDIEGTEPGESADVIRGRNAAAKRVVLARENGTVNSLAKTTNAQRASQVPTPKKPRVYNPPARPGRRTKGDTPQFVSAARRQAAITAKNAAKKDQ